MINLDKSQIRKLEYVQNGGFGVLYKKDNLIYKLYRNKVNCSYSLKVDNPSLRYCPLKIRRLMRLNDKLLYTDLVQDIIFVDGKFAGVVLPFYDGKTFSDSDDLPFEERLSLSFELVRNSSELTNHYIYPMDYKLNNFMIVDGNVKIIDLDDVFTKVGLIYRPIKEKKCISNLDCSIKSFLNEFCSFPSSFFKDLISKSTPHANYSYDDIIDYLKGKSRRYIYVVINDDSDIYSNIKLIRDSNVRVIYERDRYNGYDDMELRISQLNEMGISIYDVILSRNIDNYFNNVLFNRVYEIKGESLFEKNFAKK